MEEGPKAADLSGSLVDLLIALAAQRHDFEWPAASQSIQSLLASGCQLEGLPEEAPSAVDCETRYSELSQYMNEKSGDAQALIEQLVSNRLKALTSQRTSLLVQINELSSASTTDHTTLRRSASTDSISEPPTADVQPSSSATAVAAASKAPLKASIPSASLHSNSIAFWQGPPDYPPLDAGGVDEKWSEIAEEEDKNSRRASVSGTLTKMLMAIMKHKWAYPFKRPVTDKEAPDYKDIIKNPMDFSTLRKRVESGIVNDANALVSDLFLIFDNAMIYNLYNSRSCQLVESAYRDLHCVTQLLRMRRVPRQFLVCEVDRQEEALDASEVSRQLHLSRPRIRWVREESAPGVSACLQKV
ncbi:MAG: hypothetical protein SGPRY_001417 [Prymnesium sp.]